MAHEGPAESGGRARARGGGARVTTPPSSTVNCLLDGEGGGGGGGGNHHSMEKASYVGGVGVSVCGYQRVTYLW